MKLKSILSRVIVYGSMAVFLNYFGLPATTFVYSNIFKKEAQNRKVQQVCETDKHLESIVAGLDVKQCEALDVLKLAHAVTSRFLSLGGSYLWKNRKAFEKGTADCAYYSVFTYNNFLYLADKLDRRDLKDKVKLALGCAGYNGIKGSHAWLKVYSEGKWRDYESTIDNIGKEENLDFKTLDKLEDKHILDLGGYNTYTFVQFEDGKLVSYTNILGSIEAGTDLLDLLKCFLKK